MGRISEKVQRVNLIHALRGEGKSMEQIAGVLGVTRQAISYCLKGNTKIERMCRVCCGRFATHNASCFHCSSRCQEMGRRWGAEAARVKIWDIEARKTLQSVGMIRCFICKAWLEEEEFPPCYYGKPSGMCRGCNATRAREWYARKRNKQCAGV